MFGLQVAFVHPEATGGVLAEFVGNELTTTASGSRSPSTSRCSPCSSRSRPPTISTARSQAGQDSTFSFEADDGRYTILLRRVVYVKRFARESRVGFGAAA